VVERLGETPAFDMVAIAAVLGREGFVDDKGNHRFSLSSDPESMVSVLMINPERRSVDCPVQENGVRVTMSLSNVAKVSIDLAGREVEFRGEPMPAFSDSRYDVISVKKVEDGFAVAPGMVLLEKPFHPD